MLAKLIWPEEISELKLRRRTAMQVVGHVSLAMGTVSLARIQDEQMHAGLMSMVTQLLREASALEKQKSRKRLRKRAAAIRHRANHIHNLAMAQFNREWARAVFAHEESVWDKMVSVDYALPDFPEPSRIIELVRTKDGPVVFWPHLLLKMKF